MCLVPAGNSASIDMIKECTQSAGSQMWGALSHLWGQSQIQQRPWVILVCSGTPFWVLFWRMAVNSRWGEEFWGCSLPPSHCKEATGSLSQQAQSLPAWLLLRGQHRPLAHVTWMELAVDSQASMPARALPALELHMGDRYCWSGIGLKVVQVGYQR